MDKLKIIIIGGSLESNSSTSIVMDYCSKVLNKIGVKNCVYFVKDIKIPYFSYSNISKIKSKKFKQLISDIQNSDGYIFISPEYHGTVSASFKNIIDYLEVFSNENPPYLTLKPIGCITVAGAENGGYSSLNTLMNIVYNLRAIFIPSSFAIGLSSLMLSKDKKIRNDAVLARIERLIKDLLYMARILKLNK